jgi:hypothetical protein
MSYHIINTIENTIIRLGIEGLIDWRQTEQQHQQQNKMT